MTAALAQAVDRAALDHLVDLGVLVAPAALPDEVPGLPSPAELR
ncbi:MAG: hypothetical protein AAGB93_25120 [Planctomycetota bacterium]